MIQQLYDKQIEFRHNNYRLILNKIVTFKSFESSDIDMKKIIEFRYTQKRKKITSLFCIERINLNEYPVQSICVGFRLNIMMMRNMLLMNITRSVIASNYRGNVINVYNLPRVRDLFIKKSNIDLKSYFKCIIQCSKEISECLSDYGIRLSSTPLKTTGYKLSKPKLLPENDEHKPFYMIPPKSMDWVLYIFDENFNALKMDQFKFLFYERAKFYGINLKSCPDSSFIQVKNATDIRDIISDMKQKMTIDFALFGICRGSKLDNFEIYELIKYYGNTVYGIVNQVFCTDNLYPNNRYMDTLIMKICMKIGGQPNIVHPYHWNRFPFDPDTTMIVGIDDFVKTFQRIKLNFISFVGTVDDIFIRYISEIRIFRKLDDSVYESMFANLLDEYQKRNDYFPTTIIIFQKFPMGDFKKVLTSKSLNNVKLTVIYVDKFTSSHFMPSTMTSSSSCLNEEISNHNGTSVNMNFLYPNLNDNLLKEFIINIKSPTFDIEQEQNQQYLKPSLYTIFLDDCNFTLEQLQDICFTMCHYYYNYFGCSTIPAPMEYAYRFARDACSRFAVQSVDLPSSEQSTIDEMIEYFHQNSTIHDNLEYSIF
ncbi:piwi-domain-containing protein [Dermatophagoides farinae]|uniref:Piwi-domain-containing protein n=1 Tax=Dermatophagoides farinae TaxID=6954 RepID=A0A9D4SLV5_DERFA|nr:piwi-like protein 1 [Dermatophagoides farinae]KAH7646507.1 piwi-domain-containing protein [Dermatophagoides farinae]